MEYTELYMLIVFETFIQVFLKWLWITVRWSDKDCGRILSVDIDSFDTEFDNIDDFSLSHGDQCSLGQHIDLWTNFTQ